MVRCSYSRNFPDVNLHLHKLLLLTCDFCERHLKKFSEWFHYHVEANWRSGKFSPTCALVSSVYSKKYCRLRWADDSFTFACISSAIKHAHTISCETRNCHCVIVMALNSMVELWKVSFVNWRLLPDATWMLFFHKCSSNYSIRIHTPTSANITDYKKLSNYKNILCSSS